MRITFLGTSHGDPTYCRFNSGILFEIGERSYVFDAGEPVTAQMVRLNKPLGNLKAVFITHMHDDHAAGLPLLLRYKIKKHADGDPLTAYIPDPAAIDPMIRWMAAMYVKVDSPAIAVTPYSDGLVYDDGVLSVSAEPNGHLQRIGDNLSYSLIIRAEGKRIIYTGDLRGDFSDFPAAAREVPSDLVICETTHYDYANAYPILKDIPTRRLIHTHIGNKWHWEGEKKLRDWLEKYSFPATYVSDGEEIEL